jgi:hypothetical protein
MEAGKLNPPAGGSSLLSQSSFRLILFSQKKREAVHFQNRLSAFIAIDSIILYYL